MKIKKPTVLETWIDLFPFLENVNWSPVYSLVYKISVCEILFGIINFSYGECNVFCNKFDNIAWKIVPQKM